MERAQKLQRARDSGQHGLFGGGSSASRAPPPEILPEVEEWPEHEILAAEYATLGFYISGHPLDKYAGRLKDLKATELSSMEGQRNNEDIVVAGIIVQARPMRSRRGARWAILTLQDRTGVIEALVFPGSISEARAHPESSHAASGERTGSGGRRGDARDRVGCARSSIRWPTVRRACCACGRLERCRYDGALNELHELFRAAQADAASLSSSSRTMARKRRSKLRAPCVPTRNWSSGCGEICGSDSVAVVQ